ncbi:uncharacterized protein DUF262 [Agitococcus lubricus]|uniref:Uncharacterized protein DUF262 n=2 Tax=Agitococcus lubricus TaxID=1077255 RepID=A0A2T5IWM5_9GAMM|nr:uncharacterized protein DUF262 [Agitococcus lubricus]
MLTLEDVAAWQVDDLTTKVRAVLPALQRGAVWKPAQTEKLWDSLMRGFPIGAFLLSKYNEERYGKADMKLGTCEDPEFHLLDGQQRATAIALGFYDIWKPSFAENRINGPAIWLDLATPPENDDRDFIFRVITRSHPWGYKFKTPEERLSYASMTCALNAYKTASPELKSLKTSDIPLSHVWPWDAEAPIPLAFLINAIKVGGDIIKNLRQELNQLPFWSKNTAILANNEPLRDKLESIFDAKNTKLKSRLDFIINILKNICSPEEKGITVQLLPSHDNPESHDEHIDPIETLFVRINSSGTRLEGEELMYSLLKSAWRDAPQAIGKLQPNNKQWVSPARLALLITRMNLIKNDLCKSSDDREFQNLPPVLPDIARFRRIMHQANHIESMKAFVAGDLSSLWKDASELVMMNCVKPTNTDYRLPPALAADFASGSAGNELLLLLMTWLFRLQINGSSLNKLTIKQRKRTLGFLVSMSWFSQDIGRCIKRLWPILMTLPPNQLPEFFNSERFQCLLPADEKSGLIMLPLVTPDNLKKLIENRITSGSNGYPGINNINSDCFSSCKTWENYTQRLSPYEPGIDGFNKLPIHMREWLSGLPLDPTEREVEIGNSEIRADAAELRRHAWRLFLDRLWYMKKIVDYAQRDYLVRWFPDFDPTQPGQMEDINRPWDYDHIHAAYFIAGRHNIPGLIREWHQSIGNLRCWPLDLNRADQHCTPIDKLGDDIEIEENLHNYGFQNAANLRTASFIDDSDDWQHWQHSVADDCAGNYLASDQYHENRVALIKAICFRFCRLYENWYKQLDIGRFAKIS